MLKLDGSRAMTGDLDLTTAYKLVFGDIHIERQSADLLKIVGGGVVKGLTINIGYTNYVYARSGLTLGTPYVASSTIPVKLRSSTGAAFKDHINAVGGSCEFSTGVAGYMSAVDYRVGAITGKSGTFISGDAVPKTISVLSGIITQIV